MSNIKVQRNPQIKFTQLFINNKWMNAASGKTYETLNPATGEPISRVQEGDKQDIDQAVRAAKDAFHRTNIWRTIDASTRGETLWRLADMCQRDLDYITCLETLDSGKPVNHSRDEVQWAIDTLRYYAGYADKVHGNTIPVDGHYMAKTRKEPIGVCGLIVPMDIPFYFMINKLAPALAAGCTVVVKPAKETPLTALYLAHLVNEAGFPPGVVNMVPGYGHTAGAALAEHMDVRLVSFTGPTEIGKKVMHASAQSNLNRVILETGSSPAIVVFPDSDIDLAAKEAHMSLFMNSDQACTSATRVYVHESIHDQFVNMTLQLVQKTVLGDPFDTRTEIGPLVSDEHLKSVLSHIETGRRDGAKLVYGGKRVEGKGFFMQPTVFTDVMDNMKIARDEVYGPVMAIMRFKDMDEVVERINDSPYGLSAAVFTRDINKVHHFQQAVRTGNVWINTYIVNAPQLPFGGYKMSGLDREGGERGILAYMETKTIVTKVNHKFA